MKLEIAYSNLKDTFTFNIEAFLINKTEAFAVGYNLDTKQYEILGFFRNNNNRIYFYGIKFMKSQIIEKIIKGKDGESFDILSDISTGFWTLQPATKVSGKYFKDMIYAFDDEGFVLGNKTNFGLLIPSGENVKVSSVLNIPGIENQKTSLLINANKIEYDFTKLY